MRIFLAATLLLAGTAAPRAADVGQAAAPEEGAGFSVVAGATALVVPLYEGSEEYRVIAFPMIYPSFGGEGEGLGDRLTVRGLDDVRFALFRRGGFELGPAGGYTFGREEDDADRLDGLGDVDGGLVAGAYAAFNLDPFFVDIAYLRQVTGDSDGGQLKIAGGLRTEIAPKLDLTATLGAAYATGDYMDAYFSVTPDQSARSGLEAFDAGAGFKSVGLDVEIDYGFSDKLTLSAGAGYSRLVGDTADSPVIETENQLRGSLGLTYSFGPF